MSMIIIELFFVRCAVTLIIQKNGRRRLFLSEKPDRKRRSTVPAVPHRVFDPKMVNHSITFYHYPLSPPSRAALLVVRTLGIKHDLKIVDIFNGEQHSPAYLKINPFHTVPTVDDGGFYLYDSCVIMKYLSKQYAKDDSLFPKEPRKAALVGLRMYFGSNYLFPALRDYFAPVFFENVQPSTEKAKKFEERLQQLNDFLENETWVAGKDLTIADFCIVSIVSTAEAIMFHVNKYPNVSTWYKRAKEAMAPFGYEEIMQDGSDKFGNAFKEKLK